MKEPEQEAEATFSVAALIVMGMICLTVVVVVSTMASCERERFESNERAGRRSENAFSSSRDEKPNPS